MILMRLCFQRMRRQERRIEALGEDVEEALDALRDARRARAEACDEAQEAGVSYATLGGWLDITAAAVRRAVLEARS